MSEQVTVRLDDYLIASARDEARAAGATLAEWVRQAIRHQLARSQAMRARAEEDRRGSLYTEEQEDALLDARQARAIAAFRDPDADAGAGR